MLALLFIASIASKPTTGNPPLRCPKYQGGLQASQAPETHDFDVLDIRNVQFNKYELQVLASVEGIVNMDDANVYVLDSSCSELWLEYFNASPYIGHARNVANLSDIINMYASHFAGIVVFDGDSYDEVNLASPLAGVHRALLVPNQIAGAITGTWDVITNVTRDLQDCTTRVERYQYAIEHYFPLCNQTAFAIWDGTIARHMRNFIISNSLFTFWKVLYVHTDVPLSWGGEPLDPDPPEERAVFESFLASTPPNMAVIGFPWADGANEGEVIWRISRANKYLIPTDFFENLAFTSRMKLPRGYEFVQQRPASYPALENKVYISGIWSDGDNIQYVYNHMRPVLWDGGGGTGHGLVPTGWTVNPSLYWMAPYVLKFYYEHATANDSFVGGLSGKGYCKPDYFTDESFLHAFINESNRLYELTDMSEGRIWDIDETAGYITSATSLAGIFDGYGGPLVLDQPRVVNGIPIFRHIGVQDDTSEHLEFIEELSAAVNNRPMFFFFHLHCWTCNTTVWTELASRLNEIEGVEVVRPDVLVHLVKEWHALEPVMAGPVAVHVLVTSVLAIAGLVLHIKRRENRFAK